MSDIPSPISATEKYLSKMAGSYSGDLPSPSNRTEAFMYYAAINSGGGGEGTTDYTQLENKPSINGVTLTGNKTTADLNLATDLSNYYTKPQTDAKITEKVAEIVADAPEDFNTLKEMSDWIASHEESAAAMNSAIQQNTTAIAGKVDKVTGKGLSTNDYTTEEKTKLAGIETEANKTVVDSALDSSSTNPVQNKVIKESLDGKVDKVSGKGLSTNDYTTEEKTKLAGLSNYDDTQIYEAINSLSSSIGTLGQTVEGKVDKITGKGLSTEDYTTSEKTKLSELSNYDDTALTSRVSSLETTVGDINSVLEEVL